MKGDKKTVMLFGANGQLGMHLRRLLPEQSSICLTRDACDLENADAIISVLDAYRPACIINAAAYTNVEKAEDEPERAHAVNADAPGIMAEWAARHAAQLLHVSTDYVFDGNTQAPYSEEDTPQPLNAYGQSKYAGEQKVLRAAPHALVLRVAWLFDPYACNFFSIIGDKLRAGEKLRVVDDQYGTPSYAPAVADAILRLAACEPMPRGLLHLASPTAASWYAFACGIAKAMQDAGVIDEAEIAAISSQEYPTRATRPKDSRLNCTQAQRRDGLCLPRWQDAVVEAVKRRYAV